MECRLEVTPFQCDVCQAKVTHLYDATMHTITARLMGYNFSDKPKTNGKYDIRVCDECRDINRKKR